MRAIRLLFSVLCLAPITGVGAVEVPKVVELFTSQGCSSCPPADELLGELARRPDVIALSYHVDYWDHLGWTDRFSLAAATARQTSYARSLHLSGLYTPQMVIDGRKDVVGSDRARVLAALQDRSDGVALTMMRDGDHLIINLPVATQPVAAEITLVAYERQAATKVMRGENAGRSLTEYGVVRSVRSLGQWHGDQQSLSVALTSLPAGAGAVALLIQAPGSGPILGAASLAL